MPDPTPSPTAPARALRLGVCGPVGTGKSSLIALLCIGYPADTSDTPELERHGWQPREPWSDRVFER